MRADRLLSALLLLQTHGRLTASALAERLEVSKRTVERDMEALSMAGVPVSAVRGRGGGWELSEGYRTDLTGMTEDELRSLILSTAPHVVAGLGLGAAADRALVKLLATLPGARRHQAEAARSYIHVDPAGWRRHEDAAPLLPELDQALRQGRRVSFEYERMDGSIAVRTVDPLGLVAKGSVWYLVAAVDGTPRTYRASRIRDVRQLDEPVVRPTAFDLAEYWGRSRAEFEARLPAVYATFRIAADAISWIERGWIRYARVAETSPPDADGWCLVRVRADTVEILQALALGLGTRAEVVDPPDLDAWVMSEARAVVERASAATPSIG